MRTQELTKELHTITQENRSDSTHRTHNTQYEHNFSTGDRVIVTNNYLGQQGTRSIVVHTTKKQIKIKDKKGNIHTRAYKNIQHE